MAGYSDPDECEMAELRAQSERALARISAREADIRKLRKLIHDMARRWTPDLSVDEVDGAISAALGEAERGLTP